MSYNCYPTGYQQVYPVQQIQQPVQQISPQMQMQQPQTQQVNANPFNWVDGESSARSYGVAPGQSVMLMDSNANVFYIKSADASGMPLPLRIFDYTERTQQAHTEPQIQAQQQPEYVTREEFEKRIAEILEPKKLDDSQQRRKGN